MDAVRAERELIARQQFDVRDRRFEFGLRAEAAPQEAARAGFGRQRVLRTRHRGIREHRVVSGQHLEPPHPQEIRACVADMADQRLMPNEHDRGQRGSAADEIFVASAERVEAGVGMIECREEDGAQPARRRAATEGTRPMPPAQVIS